MDISSLDLSIITTAISIFSAAIAISSLLRQDRMSRTTIGVDALLRYQFEFRTDGVALRKRWLAANALEQYAQGKLADPASADTILDTFEDIGILLNRKVIDIDLVWSLFGYYALGYWKAGEKYIASYRAQNGRDHWLYYEKLINALISRDKRHYHETLKQSFRSTMEVDKFLRYEVEKLPAFFDLSQIPVTMPTTNI